MKKIAITVGEPGGIGPEVSLKAIEGAGAYAPFIPVIIGDAGVIEDAAKLLNLSIKLNVVKGPEEAGEGIANVIDTGGAEGYEKGRPTEPGGRASAEAIKKAVELAMNGSVEAIVTAPISKEALRMAGLKWPGHTEMLAELTGTKDYAMMLVGEAAGFFLRVILVTTHVALKDVPGLITGESVLRTIRLAEQACRMLSIENPKIAVAGLNPHAGEGGIMGNEETSIIIPAVEAATKEGIPVSGPYPPDTLYHRAYKGEFDIVVSMYHDQGLIPLKLVAFESSVNVTVGLPIIRTSPGHGTAYGIAWRGVANPSAMIEAVTAALRLRKG